MTQFRASNFTNIDETAIVSLWQEVFKDKEAYIKACLEVFAGPGQVYVAEEFGSICAVLLAVPCAIKSLGKGVYLYGLATTPEKRGQGIMGGLMAYAEEAEKQKGALFAALMPARKRLFEFYYKHGYTNNMRAFTAKYVQGSRGSIEVTIKFSSAADLKALRKELLNSDYVDFDDERMQFIAEDMCDEDVLLAYSYSAYAVFTVKGQSMRVVEMCAQSADEAEGLLFTMCEEYICDSARVVFAGSEAMLGLFPKARKTRIGAMKLLYAADDEVYGAQRQKLCKQGDYGYICLALEEI